MFDILKHNFFNLKIYIFDLFCSQYYFKNNIPKCQYYKLLFPFFTINLEKVKKFNLTDIINIQEARELIYNIKILCFINPDNIYKHYKLIKEKFNDDKYIDFFTYFD